MATHKVDVVVVGTGPGGYVAAIRCAQLGLSVATVEDDRPGGVCLNWGCIPTKALLRNAEVVNLLSHAADFGIRVSGFEANYAEAVQRSRRVADRMAKGVEFLFRKNKITLFPGRGTLKAKNVVEVKGTGGIETLEARAVILATGSEPRSLPGVTIDEKAVISSNGAVRSEAAPRSIVVIGAGAVGVEFADVYASYGVQVTLLEALPRVVPIEDEDVSKQLTRTFARRGITVKTGVKVTAVKPGGPGGVIVDLGGEQIEAEQVLMAVGRAAKVAGLGLETVGVQLERGFVKVSPHMETSVKGLYAIGDMAGAPAARPQGDGRGRGGGRGDRRQEPAPGRLRQRPVVHVLPSPGRLDRSHRGARPRERARGDGRAVPVHGQRQGGGARRDGRLRQGGRRQGDRRDPRRPHHRARGDGDHPRVRASGAPSRPPSRRSSTRSTPIRPCPRRPWRRRWPRSARPFTSSVAARRGALPQAASRQWWRRKGSVNRCV